MEMLPGPLIANKNVRNAPGPGPEGPWALWPQYPWGNLELLGRSKKAFYW